MRGESQILDVAREVTMVTAGGPRSAIVGGVATVLHGYVRTTTDVDLLVDGSLEQTARLLQQAGFTWRQESREFLRGEIPVHLVTPAQTRQTLDALVEFNGIRTIPLAALIQMKLASGTRHVLRAIDLADVIGLIRVNKLDKTFAAKLRPALRPAFRKLVAEIQRER